MKGVPATEIFCWVGEKKRFEDTCKSKNEYFAGLWIGVYKDRGTEALFEGNIHVYCLSTHGNIHILPWVIYAYHSENFVRKK